MSVPRTTRFAGFRPWVATLILAATGAAVIAGLAVSRTPGEMKPPEEGRSDWHFYQQVVNRVRAGESYYDALPRVFPEFRFTPFSVFNFRTPVYAWLIGGLPSEEWARALLAGLALLTLGLGFRALRCELGGLRAAAGAFLLLGGLGWCFLGMGIYAQELWAGTLITMSISLYVLGRWPLAVLAGLTALFFRELTLPYCILALAFAVWQKRPAEVIAWVGGLALYAVFLTWHLARVTPLLPPSPKGSSLDWVAFGGLPFLLATARMNFFLLVFLPGLATAFFLPLAVLGLAGWRGEMGTRVGLTVAAYLAAFGVIGQPFNLYWGFLYAPLLGLGLLWMPAALRDLWRTARFSDASEKR